LNRQQQNVDCISNLWLIICSNTKKERGANDNLYPFTSNANLSLHIFFGFFSFMSKTRGLLETVAYIYFLLCFRFI